MMGGTWRVIITVHPYSMGRGRDFDAMCGGVPNPQFDVAADSAAAALDAARLIVAGIRLSPFVWEAHIKSIAHIDSNTPQRAVVDLNHDAREDAREQVTHWLSAERHKSARSAAKSEAA